MLRLQLFAALAIHLTLQGVYYWGLSGAQEYHIRACRAEAEELRRWWLWRRFFTELCHVGV